MNDSTPIRFLFIAVANTDVGLRFRSQWILWRIFGWCHRITRSSTRISLAMDGSRVSGGSVIWPLLGFRYRRPVLTPLYKKNKEKTKGTWVLGDS